MNILEKTKSICNKCMKIIDAEYVKEDNKVFFVKNCQEHGAMKTLVANDAADYMEWVKAPVINIPPKSPITKGEKGQCFHYCGTCENHLQTACCVLLDVTERCNQNCVYCFAKEEEGDTSKDPSLETIEKWYEKLISLGEERPFNIQLSGGEPTVREDLPEIIKMGKDKGFEYIQLNTNGRRIARENGYAKLLKKAGVSVVFLQFDGTNDDIYTALRGEALFEEKKKAIHNCKLVGIPVTLVPTVVKDVNLNNIGDMMSFLLENLNVVKGIHFQPVSFFGRHPEDCDNRVTMFDVMHQIEVQTEGKFKYEELYPISTGHSLCCFCGSYIKEQNGHINSLMSKEKAREGISCCEAEPLDVIKKDRDFVLNKWELPEYNEETSEVESPCCCCCQDKTESNEMEKVLDFDQMLFYLKSNMFTVSGMAFQDLSNLDQERVKRCRVQVFTEDERLIPFCNYNSFYRK